ncbi:MAG: ATP-binding cassette domain-containing protein [Actinobacteria bacterium]|nr:MAG: ATP-binding cassette domain-containing protein [Actinomycetota bacterium]
MNALAEARGVVVSHGINGTSIRALNGVDFAVEEHESVALWGPSGSGKTTLLHVLGGLVGPTSGSILWRGEAMPTLQESAQGSVRGVTAWHTSSRAPSCSRPSPRTRTWPSRAGRARPSTMGRPPPSCWDSWGSRRSSTRSRPSSRAARPSAWRSRAPWRRRPSCCSATSRPASSTRTPASACLT